MPSGLKSITRGCFIFALFLPLAFFPGDAWIAETPVTHEEFWRQGGGPLFVFAGIVFPIIGYGFVRARNWARYAYLAAILVATIASCLQPLVASLPFVCPGSKLVLFLPVQLPGSHGAAITYLFASR